MNDDVLGRYEQANKFMQGVMTQPFVHSSTPFISLVFRLPSTPSPWAMASAPWDRALDAQAASFSAQMTAGSS